MSEVNDIKKKKKMKREKKISGKENTAPTCIQVSDMKLKISSLPNRDEGADGGGPWKHWGPEGYTGPILSPHAEKTEKVSSYSLVNTLWQNCLGGSGDGDADGEHSGHGGGPALDAMDLPAATSTSRMPPSIPSSSRGPGKFKFKATGASPASPDVSPGSDITAAVYQGARKTESQLSDDSDSEWDPRLKTLNFTNKRKKRKSTAKGKKKGFLDENDEEDVEDVVAEGLQKDEAFINLINEVKEKMVREGKSLKKVNFTDVLKQLIEQKKYTTEGWTMEKVKDKAYNEKRKLQKLLQDRREGKALVASGNITTETKDAVADTLDLILEAESRFQGTERRTFLPTVGEYTLSLSS